MLKQRPATITITGWVLLITNFFVFFNTSGVFCILLIGAVLGSSVGNVFGTGAVGLTCTGFILSSLMGLITGGAVLQGKKAARRLYLIYLAVSIFAFWYKMVLVLFFIIWYVVILILLNRKVAREYFNTQSPEQVICDESKRTIIRKTIGGFLFIISVGVFTALGLVTCMGKVNGHEIVIGVLAGLPFIIFFLVPGIFIWGRKDVKLLIGVDCTILGFFLLEILLLALIPDFKEVSFFEKNTIGAATLFSAVLLTGIKCLHLHFKQIKGLSETAANGITE